MILRLAWRAYLYYVQIERKDRLYIQVMSTPNQISDRIREEVALKIVGLKTIADDDINKRISHN
ncbi:hypothetical protein PTKIN_Ptkin05aG0156700 [Pterospermum kingtungense]